MNNAKQTKPAVSVLMPVFNERRDSLEQAVQSILDQTFTDFEFVLLDDGSTREETKNVLTDLARQDDRIRLFLEPHRGLTKTLKVGLDLCRAPLVCRQDSDDWSLPHRLERQVAFLEEHPEIAVVGSAIILCRENGAPLWTKVFPKTSDEVRDALPIGNPFCHGALCFRTNSALELGGYREYFADGEDYDLVWRLCDAHAGANMDDVFYMHRRTASSVSALRSAEQTRINSIIKYLGRQRRAGEAESFAAAEEAATRVVRADTAMSLLGNADQQLLAGGNLKSLRLYMQAIGHRPLYGKAYLKVLRAILFMSIPSLRPRLFGN